MDVYKLIREGERRALKAYFSGEPLEQVIGCFLYLIKDKKRVPWFNSLSCIGNNITQDTVGLEISQE